MGSIANRRSRLDLIRVRSTSTPGYVYNPVGAFFHWLLNMTKAGGYPKC